MSGGEDQSALRLWKHQYLAGGYKKEFFDQWREQKLDGIICPSFPIVACPLADVEHMNSEEDLIMFYNYLFFMFVKSRILWIVFIKLRISDLLH